VCVLLPLLLLLLLLLLLRFADGPPSKTTTTTLRPSLPGRSGVVSLRVARSCIACRGWGGGGRKSECVRDEMMLTRGSRQHQQRRQPPLQSHDLDNTTPAQGKGNKRVGVWWLCWLVEGK